AGFGDDHHPMTDGGCSDCHVAHSDEPMLVKKTGEALCFECHLETMAQFRMPSHHPVREGFLECSDCHSVHGKKQAQFVGIDDREECLGCHTEKQGPFIFEHEPVNEDCKICHNPHGSVANNLLKQAEPFVCLSCHPMHFHTAITGLDSDFSAPLYPGLGGTSTKDAFKKAMLTKCTQCHSQVHGSDLPSQGITSLGQGLTR
ncbi:MAG: cytochrome C, partial [candidate division Zixibacteria bacterium]|nr:cytochrome C [candidate division Zixibacteria bacterium]